MKIVVVVQHVVCLFQVALSLGVTKKVIKLLGRVMSLQKILFSKRGGSAGVVTPSPVKISTTAEEKDPAGAQSFTEGKGDTYKISTTAEETRLVHSHLQKVKMTHTKSVHLQKRKTRLVHSHLQKVKMTHTKSVHLQKRKTRLVHSHLQKVKVTHTKSEVHELY